jgi:hypothetical protein
LKIHADFCLEAKTALHAQPPDRPPDQPPDVPCVRVYRSFGLGPAKVNLQIRTGNGYAHADLNSEMARYIAMALNQHAAVIKGFDTSLGWARYMEREKAHRKAQRAKQRAKKREGSK